MEHDDEMVIACHDKNIPRLFFYKGKFNKIIETLTRARKFFLRSEAMPFKRYVCLVFVFLSVFINFAGAQEMDKTKIDLVNIKTLDSSIIIDLKYASKDNFFGKVLYSSNTAYLRKSTADKLILAHKKLQEQGFGIKIWDAYRPLSVQKIMWELKPDANYVANPETGSAHNRGCAIDVTLVDKNGKEVTMPTKFDDFSAKAKTDYAKLPIKALKNREILKNALLSEGFVQYKNEWWHFNDEDAKNFDVLNISFEELSKIEDSENAKKSSLFPSFENKKIIFDLSAIKEGFSFVNSTPVYNTDKQVYAYKGLIAENKDQDFYLEVQYPNVVLFDTEKYELILDFSKNIQQSSFFINKEQSFPSEKIFSLLGKITVKNETFLLKCRGINWQEDERMIKIKVFRYR